MYTTGAGQTPPTVSPEFYRLDHLMLAFRLTWSTTGEPKLDLINIPADYLIFALFVASYSMCSFEDKGQFISDGKYKTKRETIRTGLKC